jgi:hypothetical protein
MERLRGNGTIVVLQTCLKRLNCAPILQVSQRHRSKSANRWTIVLKFIQ